MISKKRGKKMKQNEKGKRKGWLANLLGDKSADVTSALADLDQALQQAGVAQKTVKRLHAGKMTGDAKAKLKGMLEDAIQNVETVISEITDEVPEGLAEQVVATIVSALAEVSADPDDTENEEDFEDALIEAESMTDEDEKADDEDEDEEMTKAYRTIGKQLARVQAELREQTEGMEAVFDAVIKSANAVSALAPLVAKADAIEDLLTRVKAIETVMKGKPRRATQSEETRVDETTKHLMMQAGASDEQIRKVFGLG